MKRLLLCIAAIGLAPGCGGGGGGGGDGAAKADGGTPEVKLPTAYVGDKEPGTPADYASCMADPAGPAMDTVVMGKIIDFQDDNIVVDAAIKVFAKVEDVPAKPLAMTKSDKSGLFTITIPKGAPYRLIWSNEGGKAITSNGNPVDTIPTYEFNQRFDDKERVGVKEATREAIPGLVSVIPDKALGVLAGSVRDCKSKEVGGARVKVAATAGAFDADALTFYFSKVGGSTLPTRTQKYTSGANGTFATLNIPAPGTGSVEAYGVVGGGEPKLIGKATVPVQPGAITIVEVVPCAVNKACP